MRPNFIFISGMEKCGTTALAGWLVDQGLACYLQPGSKEPYVFAQVGAQHYFPQSDGLPLLDASVGYALNPAAISNLPEHNTKIIVCLRNPFERTWSSYRMKKMIAAQGAEASLLLQRFVKVAHGGVSAPSKRASYDGIKDVYLRSYSRKAHPHVSRYFDEEARRLADGSFEERIRYELKFFLTRREFPFLSVLDPGFFYRSLRFLLEKYLPEDVLVTSVGVLKSPEKRTLFLHRLIGDELQVPGFPSGFSIDDLEFDESKPDFNQSNWDFLRDVFSFDRSQYKDLLRSRSVAVDLIDEEDLGRYLDS